VRQLADVVDISNGKLATRHATLTTSEVKPSSSNRKRKLKNVCEIAHKFQSRDLSGIKQESCVLKDLVFCVLTGNESFTKQQLQEKVVSNGGKIVENPGSLTYCVIVGNTENIRVNNCLKSNKYNVVKVDWLISCLREGILLSWKPNDMLSCTDKYKEIFEESFDRYGDSYEQDVTEDELKRLFENINEKVYPKISIQTTLEMINKYDLKEIKSLYIFDGMRFYIEKTDSKIQLLCVTSTIEQYGGAVCKSRKNATHIFTWNDSNKQTCSKRVDLNWLKNCVTEGKIV